MWRPDKRLGALVGVGPGLEVAGGECGELGAAGALEEDGDGSQRTLVFDRAEERIWPDDGVKDGIFRAAAQAVAKAWREHGNELPDTLFRQA